MANIIHGTYTIKDVIMKTWQFYGNRFEYRERDVIRRITVQEIRVLNPDRPGEPSIKYRIMTRSYPQYYPYNKGRASGVRQRMHFHDYESIIELDRLSLNTVHWKARLGSPKNWENHPPQGIIHSIYRENLNRWSRDQIRRHRESRHTYLNVGDYNAKKNGINGDFYFRCAWPYQKYGHLYGRRYNNNLPTPVTNPNEIVFFPKHLLRVIEVLMNNGVLKDD